MTLYSQLSQAWVEPLQLMPFWPKVCDRCPLACLPRSNDVAVSDLIELSVKGEHAQPLNHSPNNLNPIWLKGPASSMVGCFGVLSIIFPSCTRIVQGVLTQPLLTHPVGMGNFRCLGEVNVKVARLLFQERYAYPDTGGDWGWYLGGWDWEKVTNILWQ